MNVLDMKWYSLFVSPMRERHCKTLLQDRIIISNMQDYFGEILIPIDKKKSPDTGRVTSKKVFPGYIFLQMILNDNTVGLVKSTKYVKDILSHGITKKIPTSLTISEVQYIIKLSKGEIKTRKNLFEPGQAVRVVRGFLSDLKGVIQSVDYNNNTCKVAINILGRSLSFNIDCLNMIPEVE